MLTAEPLATFTNYETGVTAFVFRSSYGSFNVTLRDDDAGLFVDMAITLPTLEAATERARKVAGV